MVIIIILFVPFFLKKEKSINILLPIITTRSVFNEACKKDTHLSDACPSSRCVFSLVWGGGGGWLVGWLVEGSNIASSWSLSQTVIAAVGSITQLSWVERTLI
jgi:hypothetical protein